MSNCTSAPKRVYRFRFAPGVDMAEVHEALDLAVLAVESLRGSERVRAEARRASDDGLRAVAIDGSFRCGRDVAKVFVALCQREFGPSGQQIDQVLSLAAKSPARPSRSCP